MFCVVQYSIGLVAAAFLNHKCCFRCFACDLWNLMSQSQSTWSMEWISHGSVQNVRSDHSWNEICKHQFPNYWHEFLMIDGHRPSTNLWFTSNSKKNPQPRTSSCISFSILSAGLLVHETLGHVLLCRSPCRRCCHEGALTVISHVQAPVNRDLSSPSGPSRLPQQTLQAKRFSDSIWLKLTIAQIPVMISGPPGSGSGLKTIVATSRA